MLADIAIDASFFDAVYGLNPEKGICKCWYLFYPFIKLILNLYKITRTE